MIDFNTILSSFNKRGTLLKWLKKVEQALEESVLESIGASQIDETHIKFTLTFVDGSTFESDTITLPRGEKGDTGATGETGETGNGIVSIEKTSTSGLVDTYTITYTNGNTETFEVTNGKDGENGTDGQDGANGVSITGVTKTSTSGLVDTYTITYSNGNTSTFEVTNGADGQNGTNGTNGTDGVSVVNITKTSTSGLVDTYTITYSNGNTSTFDVTNGANGTDGVSITGVTINASNHLIVTLSNGNTIDAGAVSSGGGSLANINLTEATLVTKYVASGKIQWVEIGNVVFVYFQNLLLKSGTSSESVSIATGLPKIDTTTTEEGWGLMFQLNDMNIMPSSRVALRLDIHNNSSLNCGEVRTHWTTILTDGNNAVSGLIMYQKLVEV